MLFILKNGIVEIDPDKHEGCASFQTRLNFLLPLLSEGITLNEKLLSLSRVEANRKILLLEYTPQVLEKVNDLYVKSRPQNV